jgi:HK97 gp10 family phage protein
MAEDGISISVEGLSELQATLEDLSTKQADTCIRKALKAGASIEQAAIIERAPIKVEGAGGAFPAGALANDIVVRMTRDEQGNLMAVIGPDKLTRRLASWVEYGHRLVRGGYSRKLANGKTRGPGSEVGTVPAYPFIRPAYEATQQAVTDAMATTLATEIEKAAAKNS